MKELSLHILDAIENSLEADATQIELTVEEDPVADQLVITIADNGRGMDEETMASVLDPFFTTRRTRHVGLGLPLFAAAADRCGGQLTVASRPSHGTLVRATFQHSHIDRAPLGDMTSTLLGVLVAERGIDLRYSHRVGERVFEFDTADMRQELGDTPLSHPLVRGWLAEFIAEGEQEVGRLDEPAAAGGARPS